MHRHHPAEKLDHRVGEDVVAIACHHVRRVLDAHILSVRTLLKEALGARLTQHVGQTAPYEQGRQIELVRALVQPLPVLGRVGSMKAASRIPVPFVFAIGAEADVLGESV